MQKLKRQSLYNNFWLKGKTTLKSKPTYLKIITNILRFGKYKNTFKKFFVEIIFLQMFYDIDEDFVIKFVIKKDQKKMASL